MWWSYARKKWKVFLIWSTTLSLRGDDKDKDFEGEKPRPEAGMVQYHEQKYKEDEHPSLFSCKP